MPLLRTFVVTTMFCERVACDNADEATREILVEGRGLVDAISNGLTDASVSVEMLSRPRFVKMPTIPQSEDLPFPVEFPIQEGLEIVFDAGGDRKVLNFTYKPLGIEFNTATPITAALVKPNSLADKLGVEIGWEFKVIGGTPLLGMDTLSCLLLLKEKCRKLPTE